jgi:hypothetical protein
MIEHYIIVPVAVATTAPLSAYTIGAIIGATSITTVGAMKGVEYALSFAKEKDKKD